MPKFNIGVEVKFYGQGSKVVQEEFRKMSGEASKAARSVTSAADTLKFGLHAAGAAIVAMGLDRVLRALFSAATAEIRAAVTEAKNAEMVMAQVRAGIASTGAAAGVSATGLEAMAKRLQQLTTYGDDAILSMQSVLLTFTKIRGEETFERASLAVLDLATRLNTDLQSAAILVGKALNDPAKGLTALTRAGVQFSESQKQAIDAMLRVNDVAGAQRVILAELDTQFAGSAAAARDSYGGALTALIERHSDFREAVGNQLLPVLRATVEAVITSVGSWEALGTGIGTALAIGAKWVLAFAYAVGAMVQFVGTAVTQTVGLFATLLEAAARLAHSVPTQSGLGDILAGNAENLRSYQTAAESAAGAGEWLSATALLAIRSIDNFAGSAAAAAPPVKDLGESTEQAAKAALKLKQDLDQVLSRLDPIYKAEQEAARSADVLTRAYEAGTLGLVEYESYLRLVEQALRDVKNGQLEANRSIEQLPIPKQRIEDVAELAGTQVLSGVALLAEKAWQAANAQTAEYLQKIQAAQLLSEKHGITLERALQIMGIQVTTTDDLAAKARALNAEWEEFNRQIGENFLREVQSSLSGLFVSLFEGGEDAGKQFVEALKQMLFKLAAEWLAQWAITQAKMLALSLKRIAAEKAAQKALDAAGGGPMPKGQDTASLLGGSASGLSTAMGAVALWYGLVQIGKAYFDKKKSQRMDFGTQFNFNEMTGSAQVVAGASELSKAVTQAAGDLLRAFQETTGAWVTGMAGVTIMARRDGKQFVVQMEGVALGTFADMGQAVLAAFSAAMQSASFEGLALDPAIFDVLANAEDKFETPEALLDAVKLVQDLSDLGSGLDATSRAIQSIFADFQQLEKHLMSIGVSAADAARLAGNALFDSLQSSRDAITGEQQSIAQQQAAQRARAELWNAQHALTLAELELRRYELEQRLAILGGIGELSGPAGGGGAGPAGGGGTPDRTTDDVSDTMGGILGIVGEAMEAQIGMYAVWAQSTTELTGQTLTAQVQMTAAASGMAAQHIELILAQLAALDQVIAKIKAIPPIDISKLQLPGAGGGQGKGGKAGGGFGPSRGDRREAAADELESLSRDLLPAFVQELLDLEERLAKLRAEHEALGMSTEQLAAIEAAYRAELEQRAQAEVSQYTTDSFTAQLQEILAWGAEMREVYAALGLALSEVEAAERARLEALGQDALAALGSPTAATIAQFRQLADALAFLQANAASLGLTADQVAQAMAEAGQQMAMSLVDSLLQFVTNEEARMQLEQLRYQMEIANIKLQFELLKAMGLLTEDMIALIQGLIDGLPDAPPATGGGGDDGMSPTQKLQQMGQGESRLGQIRDKRRERMLEAIQELIDVVTAIRDFQEEMLRDERLAALTTEQQYLQAQQEFLDLQAAAMTGDLEAMAALPEAAEAYLLLAQEMFGSATMGYQQIFQQVYDLLEAVSALYPEGEDPDEWLKSDMQSVLDYLDGIKQAIVDGLRAAGPGAGPSMGGGSPGTSPGEVPPLLGTGFLGWQPPGGPPPPGPNPPQTESGTAQLAQGLAQLSQQVATLAASQDKAAKTMTQAVTLQPTSTSGLTKTSAPGATGGKKVA